MPFREATALVTVEREGVLSSFVTELSGKDPVIEVPMPASLCARRLCLGDGGARPRLGLAAELAAEPRARLGAARLSQDGGKPTAMVDLAKPATGSASPR